jgi:hypothetical protein
MTGKDRDPRESAGKRRLWFRAPRQCDPAPGGDPPRLLLSRGAVIRRGPSADGPATRPRCCPAALGVRPSACRLLSAATASGGTSPLCWSRSRSGSSRAGHPGCTRVAGTRRGIISRCQQIPPAPASEVPGDPIRPVALLLKPGPSGRVEPPPVPHPQPPPRPRRPHPSPPPWPPPTAQPEPPAPPPGPRRRRPLPPPEPEPEPEPTPPPEPPPEPLPEAPQQTSRPIA